MIDGIRASAQTTGAATTAPNTTADLTPGGAMGKNEFVKLLVAQMQNQDPLNPMDGKELAVQLAQFSSVEQLININTKLDDISKLLHPAASTTPTA
jgi:flagellar basal-body rod modification protein FlgD